jgi:hypothetical protein
MIEIVLLKIVRLPYYYKYDYNIYYFKKEDYILVQ